MNLIKTKSFELAVNTRGKKDSYKIAIVLPGRLDTKDYASFDSHIEFLSHKGFFAISFDPPGTWDSPGGIKLFTTTNYIKAANELIEYFGNKPTLLMGHSRGGSVAILAGSNNPSVIGIVSIMASFGGPSSPSAKAVRDGVEMEYREMPPGIEETGEKKEFALPLSYFKDGEQYSPAGVLKTCTKPKLIFYGTDDKFNDPGEVKEVFSIIPEPKMMHKLVSNHDYRRNLKVVEEVNEVVEGFLFKFGL